MTSLTTKCLIATLSLPALIEIRISHLNVLKSMFQLQDQTNFVSRKLGSAKSFEEVSSSIFQTSLSSPSCDECLTTHQDNHHGSEVRPMEDQCSDGSDSEIFRVKRRSSVKVEKRNGNDAVDTKHFVSQVLFTKFY